MESPIGTLSKETPLALKFVAPATLGLLFAYKVLLAIIISIGTRARRNRRATKYFIRNSNDPSTVRVEGAQLRVLDKSCKALLLRRNAPTIWIRPLLGCSFLDQCQERPMGTERIRRDSSV